MRRVVSGNQCRWRHRDSEWSPDRRRVRAIPRSSPFNRFYRQTCSYQSSLRGELFGTPHRKALRFPTGPRPMSARVDDAAQEGIECSHEHRR
jgi:hypothetical protein